MKKAHCPHGQLKRYCSICALGSEKHLLRVLLMICIFAYLSGAIFSLRMSTRKENEINMLKAQIETYEPELPEGFMKALDERTITRLDIFCADWDELRSLK